MSDSVNNPKHYTSHPSGVECIEIAEMLPFNLGNALKYLWRAGKKLDEVEDIKKAVFYLRRQANSLTSLQNFVEKPCLAQQPIMSKLRIIKPFDKELVRTITIICFKDDNARLALADELEIKYGLK